MKVNFTFLRLPGAGISLCLLLWLSSDAQTISTVAGGGVSSGIPAIQVGQPFPINLTFDAAGNYYIVNNGDGSIRKVNTSGICTTIAGGSTGTIADGGPATAGALRGASGLAIDASGNLYVTEFQGCTVRKINTAGIISTVAGTGTLGYNGDGIPATSAELTEPLGIALDAAGNIYIAELGDNRIRKITVASGLISTIAGTGIAGYNGDGFAATSAQLSVPSGVYVDAGNTVYIADLGNDRIRTVSTGGIINTIAGTGGAGFSGDGGSATAAQVNAPFSLAMSSSGTLYIACSSDARVRAISGGIITTIAGTGTQGFSGDGGPATSATFMGPTGIAVDSSGNVYIADENNLRIREIVAGTISTVAGIGSTTTGDGGPATAAALYDPSSLCIDRAGNIYFPDKNKVLKVTASTGNISTYAGTGIASVQGDGGPATKAGMTTPFGVYMDPAGNLYVGCPTDGRIRKVDAYGNITTFAGNGTPGFSGDGGLAINASINALQGITGDAAGNIYFTDFDDAVIRKVNTSGIISTIAGTGTPGYTGDGGLATAAQINSPNGISFDAAGNLYFGDDYINCVRKITPSGIITTVAGGTSGIGNTGDGGPATAALFGDIENVLSDAIGNLYIVDGYEHRIRRVDATTGIISAFAGNGTRGFAGDGGPAINAEFNAPWAIASDTAGNLYVADGGNARVRKITVTYSLPTNNTTIDQTFNTTYTADVNDNDFHRIITVTPTAGPNALAGLVHVGITFDPSVQVYNGQPYLTRHYDITPASNASTAQATITLYFLASEFAAYDNYLTTNGFSQPYLPLSASDLGNYGNVQIMQFHGAGTAPGNYTGSMAIITPTVHWNSTYDWWEISFPVNGFSGFFLTSGINPLPLTLLNFSGVLNNGNALLNWQTTDETNTGAFIVQRSADASSFTTIGTVAATDHPGTQSYAFGDPHLPAGTWFYRLQMIDRNEKYTYSKTVALATSGSSLGIVLYPNPAKDRIYLQISSVTSEPAALRLMDMDGNILQEQQVQLSPGSNGFSFNIAGLPGGVYFISSVATRGQVIQFLK